MTTVYSDPGYDYMEMQRHWHPGSEKYTGADALVTMFVEGWTPARTVFYEEFWHAGSRLVTVYNVDLTRGDEHVMMLIITNPYMLRILRNMNAELRPVEEREMVRRQHTNGSVK
jgi:hypothetical protein